MEVPVSDLRENIRAGRDAVAPCLPLPRGRLTRALMAYLRGERRTMPQPSRHVDPMADEDLQLALYVLYELHYRGFRDVTVDAEWDPALLAFRDRLERLFIGAVADEATPVMPSGSARDALVELSTTARGPSLSSYLRDHGTRSELAEFCIHRSAYQLKEADPHTWAIPRLSGEAKAAMVRIQFDEYGGGYDAEMHSSLFAQTMESLGLDAAYGAYLDQLPAATLATVNLVSCFGLHRRFRGALIGHLALFEMTSVVPMGRYCDALARWGVGPRGQRFYAVHVEADAEHQVIALDEMVAGALREEPELEADVAFGGAALDVVERRFTAHLLDSWAGGRSSLRAAPDAAA